MTGTSGKAGLDAAVAQLRAGLADWERVPLRERIRLAQDLRRRLGREAPGMVAAIRSAQSLPDGGPWSWEPWAVLLATAQGLRASERAMTLQARQGGGLPASAIRLRRDGRIIVAAFPQRWDERLLLGDYQGEVWLSPGMSVDEVRTRSGGAAIGSGSRAPGVALLLAAGNAIMPTVSDLVHLLFEEGCTVAVKMSPVLGYLRPALERVVAPLIASDWVRFVDESPATGQCLAHHPGVDRIHMTGSAATYDGLVWGFDEEAERRRAADAPLLDKPFTAELGGVNPLIVVPGPWTRRDLQRQADRIVMARLLNAGHICSAPQVVLLPDSWPHTDALVDEIRQLMRRVQSRAPYYPGTDAKVQAALADQAHVEVLQPPDRRFLVTVGAGEDAVVFREEVFADVLALVRLPAPSVPDYLDAAVRFANDRLAGSLAATVLIDPATARRHRGALTDAVADLRYGAVGINEWAQINALLGYLPWGAYPGHTRQSIGSGVGFTMNPFGLPTPEKGVVSARFRPLIKTPFSLTNRTAGTTVRRFVEYLTTDDYRLVPGIVTSALRG